MDISHVYSDRIIDEIDSFALKVIMDLHVGDEKYLRLCLDREASHANVHMLHLVIALTFALCAVVHKIRLHRS